MWESGQLYVGLSRVKSLDGLELVTPLAMNRIKCSDKAVEFMNHIRSGSKQLPKFVCWSEQYPAKSKSTLPLPGEASLSQPRDKPHGHCECLQEEKIVFTGESELLHRSSWVEVVTSHGGQVCLLLLFVVCP